MKTDSIVKNTVVPGTIAASAVVLASRIPFSAEAFAGFLTVFVIGCIAALEYRSGRA